MSFTELGKAADAASKNKIEVEAFLKRVGPEAVMERTSVVIAGSSWADGSLALQTALNKVLADHLPGMVVQAVQLLDAEAEEAVMAMASAFKTKPAGQETNGQEPSAGRSARTGQRSAQGA